MPPHLDVHVDRSRGIRIVVSRSLGIDETHRITGSKHAVGVRKDLAADRITGTVDVEPGLPRKTVHVGGPFLGDDLLDHFLGRTGLEGICTADEILGALDFNAGKCGGKGSLIRFLSLFGVAKTTTPRDGSENLSCINRHQFAVFRKFCHAK